jgi:hypothetical protein
MNKLRRSRRSIQYYNKCRALYMSYVASISNSQATVIQAWYSASDLVYADLLQRKITWGEFNGIKSASFDKKCEITEIANREEAQRGRSHAPVLGRNQTSNNKMHLGLRWFIMYNTVAVRKMRKNLPVSPPRPSTTSRRCGRCTINSLSSCFATA